MSDEGEVRAARGQKQLVKRRTDQVASTYMAPAAGEGNLKRRSGVWGSSDAVRQQAASDRGSHTHESWGRLLHNCSALTPLKLCKQGVHTRALCQNSWYSVLCYGSVPGGGKEIDKGVLAGGVLLLGGECGVEVPGGLPTTSAFPGLKGSGPMLDCPVSCRPVY